MFIQFRLQDITCSRPPPVPKRFAYKTWYRISKSIHPDPELHNIGSYKSLHSVYVSELAQKDIDLTDIAFDPYSSSRGRWLDRDERRQRARRQEFNFDALLDVAVKCSKGAHEVVSCEKREGGFNRVFLIEFDNKAKVVAKVPMRAAGPAALTTMSEVATLRYVKSKTRVPVPQVLAWSSRPESGTVGTEYVIMEHMSGVALHDIWSQMTGVQHIELVSSVGELAKELCALDFRAFGSLYFNASDKPAGALPLDEEFCIGPHCGRHLWGYNDDQMAQTAVPLGLQGPWQDFSSYLADLTQIGEVTISQRGSPQALVEDHLRLLETSRKALEIVKNVTTDASGPILFHPDLHARNLFVDPNDPTQIVGVIDSQSTAIEPAFVHAVETPDFAEEPLLDKTLDADISHDQEMHDDARRCSTTWAVMVFLCPKLGKATALNHLLCCYLAGVSSGYSDDIASLRSLLADVSSEWEELKIPSPCPYQPSEEDVKLLSLEREHSQSTQRLRAYLSRLLRCEMDGLVENSRWDEVVPIYREQYAGFVRACIASREEDETEEDAQKKADKLWPFEFR
ncbi:hypothetical protein LTR86_009819 [Recurvomyces mirabilis]|nr:hypothetical protein LTR86_009819 [Recurvomyces mirabilis]